MIQLQVGDVVLPRTVINAADGVRTDVGSGEGILVSSSSVAGTEQKIRLAKAYGAGVVDMEAAAVAQGAEARGIGFGAVKAISDRPISICRRWMASSRTRGLSFHPIRMSCCAAPVAVEEDHCAGAE